jgi:hypothetical protein
VQVGYPFAQSLKEHRVALPHWRAVTNWQQANAKDLNCDHLRSPWRSGDEPRLPLWGILLQVDGKLVEPLSLLAPTPLE